MLKAVVCLFCISFAATVVAENYFCPAKDGEVFECFESDPDYRGCITNGRKSESYVICSKCKRKWEFCVTGGVFQESKNPEYDCGADYKGTPCTPQNSEWSGVFKFRN